MKKSNLTQQRLLELLHYDPETGIFTRRVSTSSRARAGDIAGCIHKSGHLVFRVDRVIYSAHRLAWLYVHGVWPPEHIDHRLGGRANNAIQNLRLADFLINNQNLRTAQKNNVTGFLGVSPFRNKFKAQIGVNGKMKYLGLFETAEVAHQAYVLAKRELHPGCTL